MNPRKNKRKNFRPRNIVYSTNESEDEEKVGGGDNSPMDLSVVRPNLDSDSGMTNKKKFYKLKILGCGGGGGQFISYNGISKLQCNMLFV